MIFWVFWFAKIRIFNFWIFADQNTPKSFKLNPSAPLNSQLLEPSGPCLVLTYGDSNPSAPFIYKKYELDEKFALVKKNVTKSIVIIFILLSVEPGRALYL